MNNQLGTTEKHILNILLVLRYIKFQPDNVLINSNQLFKMKWPLIEVVIIKNNWKCFSNLAKTVNWT